MADMDAIQQRVRELMDEMDRLSEDILTRRQQMIDLDEKRQHNREALSHLVKKPKLADSKLWYNQGTLFLKMPGNDIANYIREDQKNIDKEFVAAERDVKTKTGQLYSMQGEVDKVSAFNLSPLSNQDLAYLSKAGM